MFRSVKRFFGQKTPDLTVKKMSDLTKYDPSKQIDVKNMSASDIESYYNRALTGQKYGGKRTGRLGVIKRKKNTLTRQSRKRSTRRRSKQIHNPYRM